ncbi:unnamed protein product [Cuscuta campestris]|uniref:RING-type domain-containing protein n=1 Tax=Cuscuta campestris TaxID=132261 RepID=A0A484KEF7_9ASTE|nr:unnamed protein product [Cuscuta campestris]
MDVLDIDQLEEVPDTPIRTMKIVIRPPRRNCGSEHSGQSPHNKDIGGVKKERSTSETRSEQGNFSTQQSKNQLITNGIGARRSLIRGYPRTSGPGHSGQLDCHAKSSTSRVHDFPSRNDFLFARNDLSGRQEDPVWNPQVSARKGGAFVVSSTDQSKPALGLPESFLGEDLKKGAVSSSELSYVQDMENLSLATNNLHKVKQVDDQNKVGVHISPRERKELAHNVKHDVMKNGYASVVTFPKVTGKRRLVRNGCISPHNIAKAKQPVGKDHSGFLTVEQSCTSFPATSSSSKDLSNVINLVSEDLSSCSAKGKGVMVHPSSFSEPNAQRANTSSRNIVVIDDEMAKPDGANQNTVRSFEEAGWRSTRNRSQRKSLQREKERDPQSHQNSPTCKDLSQSSRQMAVPFGQQTGCVDDHHSVIDSLGKRQKRGSTSSIHGECSTSAFDDSDIVFIGSSKDVSNNRSGGNQNHQGRDFLAPSVDVGDSSSQARNHSSQGLTLTCERDGDTRVRQVEADEILARELQEQLYNELPILGVTEIDEHFARDLQQGDVHHAFGGETNTITNRTRSVANSRRRPHIQSSTNVSRRSSLVRAFNNRAVTLRTRFPGQPRTLSQPRHRNSVFHPNVNVETRIEVLEALEAINNMGIVGSFLGTQRDFTENDYEMLLALDENNHRHAGASMNRINGLPLSVVQIENHEEACAICLETPTMGDTIRHLPCLHKFHKDCIDPWLQRRTLCPVCKSSIT